MEAIHQELVEARREVAQLKEEVHQVSISFGIERDRADGNAKQISEMVTQGHLVCDQRDHYAHMIEQHEATIKAMSVDLAKYKEALEHITTLRMMQPTERAIIHACNAAETALGH